MIAAPATPSKPVGVVAVPLVLASLLTLFLYRWIDPLGHPFVDDAGIVLRYLDHFRAGLFYTYNPADGPVFGISGFIHGLVAGGLAFVQIAPERCLVIANVLGSVLFFFFVTRIFARLYASTVCGVVATLCLLLASEHIASTFFLGLETPLHLALVMWMIDRFVARSNGIYPAGALVIVSKLDALVLAACFLGAFMLRERMENGTSVRRLAARFGIGFIAPMAAWVLFSTVIFGSPLPQTFIAKAFYHPKPHHTFFPFVHFLIRDGAHAASAAALALFALAAFVLSVWKRKIQPAAVFAFGALLALAQYYYYNPNEQMTWYYTLPEVMFLLAAGAFPLLAGAARPRRWLATALVVSVAVLPRLTFARDAVRGQRFFNSLIEPERMAVGRLADRLTPERGALATGHGHIARASRHYVLDMSGLNSKRSTACKLDLGCILDGAHAETVVVHSGLLDEPFQRVHKLSLAASFYDARAGGGAMAWRVYAPGSDTLSTFLTADRVKGGRIDATWPEGGMQLRGRTLEIDLSSLAGVTALAFGVVKGAEPQTLTVTDGEREHRCEVAAYPDEALCRGGGCTRECRIEPSGTRLTLRATKDVVLIEPVITRRMPPP